MDETRIFFIVVGAVAVVVLGYYTLQADQTETIMGEKITEIEKLIEETTGGFSPTVSDSPASGPFRIDKSQYLIGENIFFIVDNLASADKGRVIFLRPMNDTNYSVYSMILFDGSKKNSFNQYFKPALSHGKKICTTDDLVGMWQIIFEGTDYQSISFRIIDSFLFGEEKYYEDIC
ncbi:MAG: hypothetical protein NPMRTH1_890003 [Nitrosopumilales archaeon]|nr:MAG: hypothetical protein NPMRTH1_890003 [Nitrosopumilales archaeon]